MSRLSRFGRVVPKPSGAQAEAAARAAHFGGILERKGVVADGLAEDGSAFQESVLEARARGISMDLPQEIQSIKISEPLTLRANTDSLRAPHKVLLDFSGLSAASLSGAINVDCSISDGNQAIFDNMLNGLRGFRLKGAGSTAIPGAANVAAMRFFSATGKPYYYQTKNVSYEGFAVGIDLYSNTFGIAFEDVVGVSASGGTLIQCLAGGGNDYGERYNFTRFAGHNSARLLLNENASATFNFLNSSADYCDVMFDVRAGRIRGDVFHMETNKDTDYLVKVSGNEAASVMFDQFELVLNNINRTKEIFDIADTVKLGGVFCNTFSISHGAGYSCPAYVRGKGRAVANNIVRFEAQPKFPFARYPSLLRDADDVAIWAQGTATGAVPPTTDAANKVTAAASLYFAPSASTSQWELIEQIRPGQLVTGSYVYRKQNSTAGQGKLQVTFAWLDSKGTVIGTTQTLADRDGNVEWSRVTLGLNTRPPIGARSFRLRFIKSTDSGGGAQCWLDDLIINAD